MCNILFFTWFPTFDNAAIAPLNLWCCPELSPTTAYFSASDISRKNQRAFTIHMKASNSQTIFNCLQSNLEVLHPEASWILTLFEAADSYSSTRWLTLCNRMISFCNQRIVSPEIRSKKVCLNINTIQHRFVRHITVPTRSFLVFSNHNYQPKTLRPNLWLPKGTRQMARDSQYFVASLD